MKTLFRSVLLRMFLAVIFAMLILSACNNDDDDFGFIVCSQLTSNPLQINIVSINEPMGNPTTLVAVDGHSAIDPVVTPDGKTIIFSANFEYPTPTGNDPPGGSLYRMDRAGKNYSRITDDDWTWIYERSPAISSDGKTIVFMRSDKGIGSLEALDRLWMVNLDGSDKHPVFDDENPHNDYAPAFSPDGNKLTYLSDNNTAVVNVMVYDLTAGGNSVQLTSFSSVKDSVSSPFFDSSGQWIYFVLNSNGIYSMNRISVSGGDPEKVFDIPAVDMPSHDVIDAPGYHEFKPTKDFRHFVCAGNLNDALQVFTADNLSDPFAPDPATNESYDYLFPYWHRP